VAAPEDSQHRGEFLDLYKLTVEMADRISARRSTANSFFLTINSALIAVIGFVRPVTEKAGASADETGIILTGVAGLVLAVTWWGLLRSYRRLNAAKFAIVREMETELAAAPFTREWAHLTEARARPWQRYIEFGTFERVVPLIFAAIYVAAIVRLA